MKKITVMMLCSLATVVSLNASVATVSTTCTKDEAYNKMMMLGAEGGKRMQEYMKTNDSSIKLMPPALTDVGVLMEKEKYSEACAAYDKIAKEYGVDFKEASKSTLSMAELRKDGGKKGGECSLADASIRFLNVSNILLSQGLAKTLEKSDLYHQANQMMVSDPSKSCQLTEQLAKKYNVSVEDMMKEPSYK